MEAFESVRQELIVKREQLERDLEATRGHMSTIEADLERVHEALLALTGEKKSRPRKKSASKKPVPTLQDLQQHLAEVRAASPFADAGSLQKSVRARVREAGQSLSGFPTLFAQALASSPGSHHATQGHVVHHGSIPDAFPG